jgi:aspartate carbamoyltransferase regulatory subunit
MTKEIETGSDYVKKFNSLEHETIKLRNDLINDVNRLATAYPDATITTIQATPIKAKILTKIHVLEVMSNDILIIYLDAIQHHILSLNDRRQLDLFN